MSKQDTEHVGIVVIEQVRIRAVIHIDLCVLADELKTN
jgi:hypothetical protein